MLIVISPAKKLDFDTQSPVCECTAPVFPEEAQELVDRLKRLSPEALAKLLGVSAKIAELNHRRYSEWSRSPAASATRQAILAFRGDVYVGLGADDFDQRDIGFAQRHLRMLSGLYGVLRPLDLIQPYRLDMGTRLSTDRGSDLYHFWGSRITDSLARDLEAMRSSTLVNLASLEYFRAIRLPGLGARVVTPVFRERRNGEYKTISFVAKRARGAMGRYLVKNRIDRPDGIKDFVEQGYRYKQKLSDGDRWVFARG